MNPNPNSGRTRFLDALKANRNDERFRAAAVASAFVLCAVAFVLFGSLASSSGTSGIEAGKVADRDISAETDVVYVDERATALRVEAEKRLVPAVFVVDDAMSRASLANLDAFKLAFDEADGGSVSASDLVLRLASLWPDLPEGNLASRLASYPAPDTVFGQARLILEAMLKNGVAAIPEVGLERFNPETVEIRRWDSGPLVYDQVPLDSLVTLKAVPAQAAKQAKNLRLSATLSALASELAAAFARENAFFDTAQSERRMEEVGARVEPVIRRIVQGERVIRKGFIVTAEDMARLLALRSGGMRFNVFKVLGGLSLLLILFWGAILLMRRREGNGAKRAALERPAIAFLAGLAAFYFVLASALAAFVPALAAGGLLASVLPTALVAILVTMLYSQRFGIVCTMALSLGLVVATRLDASILVEVMASGLAGVLLAGRTEKRIDLIRSGALLAALQFAVGFCLGAFTGRGFFPSVGDGFWAAINGFFCSVLALGFLPLLEQWLNAATLFRLQELSDLNSPALKRLLSVAPGTYSHSVTVAHLAESACRAIGADPILARVGAYYHDIGKIEQPEYFIENQSGYNKHDEINPRLSATVLRSHVKFGLERADALRLPAPVRAIIAEHHGTSLIGYFFAQAQKDDQEVSSDDYRYPGPEPASKESAVVMLADTVEAASRTLKRPTINRLEQFVSEMFATKQEAGQLERSELTFRDLEIIKNTFVRILAGHFHSRIEYPKAREERK